MRKQMKKLIKNIKCKWNHRPIMRNNYTVVSCGISNGIVKCNICGETHRATTETGPR